jgi:hypothetical protein
MYITEQEATMFESANPTTAAIKLAKYGKEHCRSDSSCEDIDGDEDMSTRQCWNPRS